MIDLKPGVLEYKLNGRLVTDKVYRGEIKPEIATPISKVEAVYLQRHPHGANEDLVEELAKFNRRAVDFDKLIDVPRKHLENLIRVAYAIDPFPYTPKSFDFWEVWQLEVEENEVEKLLTSKWKKSSADLIYGSDGIPYWVRNGRTLYAEIKISDILGERVFYEVTNQDGETEKGILEYPEEVKGLNILDIFDNRTPQSGETNRKGLLTRLGEIFNYLFH